jgi:hypothetical protein
MWDRLDVGAWLGIAALILAIPVGVMSHLLGHRVQVYLEKRKLIRSNATRQQAVRLYNRIKSFHNRTRDRYAYYLLLAGWAAICAVASSTCMVLIVIINPDVNLVPGPPSPALILLLLAVLFALFAVIFMLALYETSRQLDRFDDYKAEFEEQWGPINTRAP